MFREIDVPKYTWIACIATVASCVASAAGAARYFRHELADRLNQIHDVEVRNIPIPFALTTEELAELRRARHRRGETSSNESAVGSPRGKPTNPVLEEAPHDSASDDRDATPLELARRAARDPLVGVSLEMLAMRRAMARGERYLESRAACRECHGDDLGGKTLLDDPLMGLWTAPNITRAGVTKGYTPADWVRILRHGVKRNGTAALMPSQDFTWLSDQELSDIAAYVVNQPPVERVMPPSRLGPLFAMRIVTGRWPLAAETLDHTTPRPVRPPAIAPTLELGRHLATTCQSCHGRTYSGGEIAGGDSSWPPARNLTFHESGLASWTLADFERALREGRRPNGETIDSAMPVSYTRNLQRPEIEALYRFFESVEKKPFGQH